MPVCTLYRDLGLRTEEAAAARDLAAVGQPDRAAFSLVCALWLRL